MAKVTVRNNVSKKAVVKKKKTKTTTSSPEAVPMPATAAMKAQERDWRAESDARTLAEAKVIMGDKTRHKLAQQKAKSMADEKMKEAKAMEMIAGGSKK